MLLHQCYEILGVNANATLLQIKKAYRKKAKEIHPDTNTDADANSKFQVLNEAYHRLLREKENLDVETEDFIYDYKKYGRSSKNKSYERYYHAKYSQNYKYTKEEKPILTQNDTYMYYIFVLIGINMLVFAAKKIFLNKWEGIGSLSGVISAIIFLAIIIYGWNVLKKS
jgi:curved DNA-binding protein CbpA